MATTLKLPFARFVAQVNTAPAEPKANYLALAAKNAIALQKCEWREAAKSAKASLVTHDFKAAHSGDEYDAYLMTGDYSASDSTEVAYAGMAAYRFTLPAAYLSGSQTLVSMSLPVTRDRFLLPGVRVVAVLSDSAQPSTSWAMVRGDASPAASETEYLKNTATRITAALDDSGTLALDLTGTDTTKKPYLWIYLTVEDYEATWTMYSKTEPRLYAIEGSAMIVGEDVTVTFSADVTPDAGISYGELNLYTGEYTKWIDLPDDTMDSASVHEEVTVAGVGSARFVAITGKNVPPSWPDIPGWALYDVTNNRFVSFTGMSIRSESSGETPTSTDITSDVLAYYRRNGGVKDVVVGCSGSTSIYVSLWLFPLVTHKYNGSQYNCLSFIYNPTTGTIETMNGVSNAVYVSPMSPLIYNSSHIECKHVVDMRTLRDYVSITESGAVTFLRSTSLSGQYLPTAGTTVDWVSPLMPAPYYDTLDYKDCCIAGTFTDFGGVECHGMAIAKVDRYGEASIKAAYPLPLAFDTRKNLTFYGTYDGSTLFVSGDFKTINGVAANGCAVILPCPEAWLLESSAEGYELPDWRKVVVPLTCGKIEKPANYWNLDYSIGNYIGDVAMATTSRVACMRRPSI